MSKETNPHEILKNKIEDLNKSVDSFSTPLKNVSSSSVSLAVTVVSDLLGGLLVGAGIGYFIKTIFITPFWVVAIFILLGGFAGLLNLYKTVERIEEKQK